MVCVAYNLRSGIDPEVWTYREALEHFPSDLDPKFFDTMNRILWEMDVTWGTCLKREYNKYSPDNTKYTVQCVSRLGTLSTVPIYIGGDHLYTTSKSRMSRYIRNSCRPSEAIKFMYNVLDLDRRLDLIDQFFESSSVDLSVDLHNYPEYNS